MSIAGHNAPVADYFLDEELSVAAADTAVAPPRARRAGAGRIIGWARARITTTPGRLVLTGIALVVGAACFGIVATGAEQSRERAVRAARADTEPLLVQSVNLYTSLSDANATVATALLAGGLEPPAARARYLHDLQVAARSLTALTRGAGNVTEPAALRTIADQLPLYSGLVEAARANNRQGFPVGAAYLRQAATLLTTSMLPAANLLYATEAERLNGDYRTGTDNAAIVALVAAVVLALGLMLLAQRHIARISRRIFNLPMLLATVALVGLSAWALVGATREQNALARAQRVGSDAVERLSAANVLLSRAQGDLSLTLVNRGTDQTDPLDFTAAMRALTASGLAAQLPPGVATYRAAAGHVQGLESGGQLESAIKQAPTVGAISDRVHATLTDEIAAAQSRFGQAAAGAASALGGLWLAIPLITILATALALLGLRQRLNEYR